MAGLAVQHVAQGWAVDEVFGDEGGQAALVQSVEGGERRAVDFLQGWQACFEGFECFGAGQFCGQDGDCQPPVEPEIPGAVGFPQRREAQEGIHTVLAEQGLVEQVGGHMEILPAKTNPV